MSEFKIVFEEINYTKEYKGVYKLREFDIELPEKIKEYFEGCEEAMLESLGGFKIEAKIIKKEEDERPQFDPEYLMEDEHPDKKKKQEILNAINNEIKNCERTIMDTPAKYKSIQEEAVFMQKAYRITKQIINKYL
jgi:hypothetical protein